MILYEIHGLFNNVDDLLWKIYNLPKKVDFRQMNKHKNRCKLNCNFEHQKDIFKKNCFAVIKYKTYKIIENKFH